METSDCIFCGIVNDPSQSEVVWDDETVLAFMDINPTTAGHVLVIPRDHHTALTDLPPETAAHMMRVGQRIAQGLRSSELNCQGINLFLSEGAVAFQEIFHSHLHLIPRYKDDGFIVKSGDGGPKATLAQAAEIVRASVPKN